jgi:hypothetical protein
MPGRERAAFEIGDRTGKEEQAEQHTDAGTTNGGRVEIAFIATDGVEQPHPRDRARQSHPQLGPGGVAPVGIRRQKGERDGPSREQARGGRCRCHNFGMTFVTSATDGAAHDLTSVTSVVLGGDKRFLAGDAQAALHLSEARTFE